MNVWSPTAAEKPKNIRTLSQKISRVGARRRSDGDGCALRATHRRRPPENRRWLRPQSDPQKRPAGKSTMPVSLGRPTEDASRKIGPYSDPQKRPTRKSAICEKMALVACKSAISFGAATDGRVLLRRTSATNWPGALSIHLVAQALCEKNSVTRNSSTRN